MPDEPDVIDEQIRYWRWHDVTAWDAWDALNGDRAKLTVTWSEVAELMRRFLAQRNESRRRDVTIRYGAAELGSKPVRLSLAPHRNERLPDYKTHRDGRHWGY